MSATIPAYVGHNTYLHWPQYLFTSANTVTYVGHNTTHLHWPKHLFTLATTPAYVGHNTSHLRQPKHLFTSAKTLVYVGQRCDLHRPKHFFTSPKTLVYVGQCCDLHWPQHLSFASTKILTCTGQNTGHNTSMCQEKYMPASATTQACVSKNTGLCKQK